MTTQQKLLETEISAVFDTNAYSDVTNDIFSRSRSTVPLKITSKTMRNKIRDGIRKDYLDELN